MKKLYSIALSALCAMSVHAQVDNTFAFTNELDDIIADGSTITVTKWVEDDMTGDIIMSSGLMVKNQTNAGAYAGMTLSLSQLSNGKLKHCFPSVCNMYNTTGLYERTDYAGIKANAKKAMQDEWMPTAAGRCTVSYTIRVMQKDANGQYTTKAEGPTVNVNFAYDPTAITAVKADTHLGQVYNLMGQPVGNGYKGLVIINGRKAVKR